ncbi:calcium-activated chloride channel-domain-containing protein, partial [Suillus lakei]
YVDVVIVFRAIQKGASFSKDRVRQNAVKAEKQYSKLIDTLTRAGLKAVGRRGESQGQLLVMVTCPQNVLANLFIVNGRKEWDLVESVMVLHDHDFNDHWIRLWTRHRIASVELEKIRDQFGDSVALYFFFLTAYTQALIFPAALWHYFYLCGKPLLCFILHFTSVVSITFVEWGRTARAYPAYFVLEAFVTQLYNGSRSQICVPLRLFTPTILFSLWFLGLLAMYQKHATGFTNGTNHEHQSSHSSSLSLKVFTLSAMNAYLGPALSAFVYVPFGENVMHFVQSYCSQVVIGQRAKQVEFIEASGADVRLSVTNQVVDTFMEIGLPYILRAVESFRNGKGFRNSNGKGHGKKKRVAVDDEPVGHDAHGREEREFLERVRSEVALPEYDVFTDYSEMVTQFGYVALWSTIWPLAPVMALLNNYIEARSDAYDRAMARESIVFNMVVGSHEFCAGISLSVPLINNSTSRGTMMNANVTDESQHLKHHRPNGLAATRELLIVPWLSRNARCRPTSLEPCYMDRSKEMKEAERVEREMKEKYLSSLGQYAPGENAMLDMTGEKDEWANFWTIDEGMDDIGKMLKDA